MSKILIAEDNNATGISVKVALEKENHTVELVKDGAEALEQINQLPITLKKLNLPHSCNVAGVDFSRFTQLEEIHLRSTQNLTPDQINQLPPTLKKLGLWDCDVEGVA